MNKSSIIKQAPDSRLLARLFFGRTRLLRSGFIARSVLVARHGLYIVMKDVNVE